MNYKKVNLSFLLAEKYKNYDIYLKLHKKFIKYQNKNHIDENKLHELKYKGVENVFLNQEDYEHYIKNKINDLSNFQNFNLKEKQKILNEFQKDQELLSKVMTNTGLVPSEKISEIEALKNKTINFIKSIDSLKSLYEVFEKNHINSVIKKQMEIIFITELLNKIPNIKKEYIEEMITAILIFDCLLSEKEYWESLKKEDPYSDKIKNHPVEIVQYIPKTMLRSFIISFIKQHHEKPDGSGYPNKIDCSDMNIFTASYVVIEDLVSELLIAGMKENIIDETIDNIVKKYRVYVNTSFDQAINALIKIKKDRNFFNKIGVQSVG